MKPLKEYIFEVGGSRRGFVLYPEDKTLISNRNKEMTRMIKTQSPVELVVTLENASLFLAWAYKENGANYEIDCIEKNYDPYSAFRGGDSEAYSKCIKKYGSNLLFSEKLKEFDGFIYNASGNWTREGISNNLLGKTWDDALDFLISENIFTPKDARRKPKLTSEEAKSFIEKTLKSDSYFSYNYGDFLTGYKWYIKSIYDPNYKYALYGLYAEDAKRLADICKQNNIKCRLTTANSKAFKILSF